jgi:hypothetical protein
LASSLHAEYRFLLLHYEGQKIRAPLTELTERILEKPLTSIWEYSGCDNHYTYCEISWFFLVPPGVYLHSITNKGTIVRSELFTAVPMKNIVFWVIKTQSIPHRKHVMPPL